MNYLKEIVGFERLAELKGLGPGERAMWYAFMSIANALGWPESFNVPNLTLQSKTGLSRKQVYDTRNRLAQKGFITCKQAGGNKAPVYTLISTIQEDDPALCPPGGTQTVHKQGHKQGHKRYTIGDTNGAQTVHKPGPYSKLNKTKLNKTSIPPEGGTKRKFGEYQNVLLTDAELAKLKTEFSDDWQARIERLSEYIASKGVKYKNHLATIRAWARKEESGGKPGNYQGGKIVSAQQYRQRKYTEAELAPDIDWLEVAKNEHPEARAAVPDPKHRRPGDRVHADRG